MTDRVEEIEKISSAGCECKDVAAHSHSGTTEIRRMVSPDLPEVERIEKENFSRPWTAEDY